jgi:hypothetical protein
LDTVDCPAGYVGSALGYVSDFGAHMIALCIKPDGTADFYIYTPDRTFSSSPANFTLLPSPPGNEGYAYGFVNDFGLAGGSEDVALTTGCPVVASNAFVYEHGQFTTIPPRAGLCNLWATAPTTAACSH